MPSLREKQRYLAYEIVSEQPIDSRKVKEEIYSKIKESLGTFGMAEAGIIMIEETQNKGIIRTNSKNIYKLRTALALVKDINGKKVLIKTLGISGILNKALKYLS